MCSPPTTFFSGVRTHSLERKLNMEDLAENLTIIGESSALLLRSWASLRCTVQLRLQESSRVQEGSR